MYKIQSEFLHRSNILAVIDDGRVYNCSSGFLPYKPSVLIDLEKGTVTASVSLYDPSECVERDGFLWVRSDDPTTETLPSGTPENWFKMHLTVDSDFEIWENDKRFYFNGDDPKDFEMDDVQAEIETKENGEHRYYNMQTKEWLDVITYVWE